MADVELQRLVVRFEADISKLEDKVNKIPRMVNAAARQVDNSGLGRSLDRTLGSGLAANLATGTAGLNSFGGSLTRLGPIGIGAAAALTAAAVSIEAVTAAAKEADALKSAADNIGITAERLQELRFAGAEFSVSAQQTDQAIQSLNAALGAMRSGVGDGRIKEAFEALGFTEAQIRNINSVSDLLPEIANRLQAVGNQAEQVQLARKLGVEALLPLLRRGGDELANLTAKARELDLVMSDELVASLAATNRELEISDQRVAMAGQRMTSVLAPAVTGVKNAFADATVALADFIGWMEKLGGAGAAANLDQSMENLQTAREQLDTLRRTNGGLIGSRLSPEARANLIKQAEARVAEAANRVAAARGGEPGSFGVPTGNGFAAARDSTSSAGGGGRSGSSGRPDQDHWEYDENARLMYWVVVGPNGVVSRTAFSNVGGVGVSALPGTGGSQGDLSNNVPQGIDGLSRPGADAVEGLNRTRDEMRETFRATFRDGVVAALHGDLSDFLISTLADSFSQAFEESLNDLADMLFDAFRGAFSQGGGGGANWISSGWNAIKSFAGFKAGGGFVPNGQWAVTGEQGPEVVQGVPGGFNVHPNKSLRNLSPGKTGGSVVVNHFTLHSPVVTQDLLDQMNAIGEGAAMQGAIGGRALAQRDNARVAQRQQRAIR